MSADVIKEVDDHHGGKFLFWCPGCEEFHGVWTNVPNEKTGARWGWNGDKVKPSFSPSIRVQGVNICHLFITNGQLQYCMDSHHALRGKTVPMIPVDQKL